MKNKKAEMGDATLMVARIFLITLIGLSIYGISFIVFDYSLNIRNVEATLMGYALEDCFLDNLELKKINQSELSNGILNYCKISGRNNTYIKINITKAENLYVDRSEVLFKEENTKNKEAIYVSRVISGESKDTKYSPGEYIVLKEINLEDKNYLAWFEMEVIIIDEI